MAKDKKNAPVHKIRTGVIEIAIWRKTVESKDGDFEVYNSSLSKSYKDKDGEWQTTNNYNLNDLPVVAMLTQKAFEWIKLEAKSTEEE